jgi:hypothetical protein
MNGFSQREIFANFLTHLALGEVTPEEWQDLVVNHYFDERLEEIRRQFVSLAIQSPKVHSWSEQEKIQVHTWVNELLRKEEFARIDDEIYESQVHPQIYKGNHDKIIAIE